MPDFRKSAFASVGRAAVPALLILTLSALIPTTARAEPPVITPHQEETMQPYIARIYFDAKAKDGSDSYYEILKNDKPVYVQKSKRKGEKFFIGTMYKDDPDATLVKMGMDVTGDGQPNLVISEWLGGANCCLTLHIFEIGPTFKKLGTIDAGYGDSGPHFLSPAKDSNTTDDAVQIHDWTFANWNTDFADSPAPKVILRYSDNAYRIAPDLMRTAPPSPSDLATRASTVKNYPPSAKGGEWPRAQVSPDLWSTMLDLIYSAHADEAWKFLDEAWPPKVNGKDKFATDFRTQLAKSKYWPAVEAMNSAKPPPAKTAQSESPSPSPTK
jgi:hypothetical protein